MATTLCKKCGEKNSGKAPDKCLGGYLPGIAHACCGHGKVHNAYCCGWEGCNPDQSILVNKLPKGFWVKRGKSAIEYMKSLGAKIP
jgi:hypothetical protein